MQNEARWSVVSEENSLQFFSSEVAVGKTKETRVDLRRVNLHMHRISPQSSIAPLRLKVGER
jgi:hypothetical protein